MAQFSRISGHGGDGVVPSQKARLSIQAIGTGRSSSATRFVQRLGMYSPIEYYFSYLEPLNWMVAEITRSRFFQTPRSGDIVYSGFGYLATADDHKVVVSTDSAADYHQLQFEIFSVKEQYWKRIQPPFRRWGLQLGVFFCNEALHWFDDLHEPAIMALDLAKDEFRTMLLPSFSNTVHLYMCGSGGYLHMFRCKAVNKSSFHYVDWHNIELWILREYDDPASWIKLFTFQVSNKPEYIWRLRPVLVMENSTVVAKLIQKLTTLKFQQLRIGHEKGKPVIEQNNVYDLTSHMIEYEETLLRITDGVGVEPKAKRLITQHNASGSRNAVE